jgi:peptide/nickel transport system ATP-binding protein
MPDDLLLSVRDLKTYFFTDEGVVKAVDGVSFDLQRGQTLGIVGESGCGKSIMARSVLRIVDRPGRIVEGQIMFNRTGRSGAGDGRQESIDLATFENDSPEMREIRGADIAMIFQEPMTSFSPVHTIGNQISEAIMLHQGVDEKAARAQVIDVLRRVGMSQPQQRVDEYSYQLSGGMRQRAMIAMALACNPVLLIADEPTTALDVTTQAQILDLMRHLQQASGMAIILITHDLGVVAEMCDEVAVMYLGRVVEQAPVDEIFHNPKHPYTRALLRSIPRIDSAQGDRLESITGSVPHPFRRPTGCGFGPRCPSFIRHLRSGRAGAAARRRSPLGRLLPLQHRDHAAGPGSQPAARRPAVGA